MVLFVVFVCTWILHFLHFWCLSVRCLYFCFAVQYEWIKQSTDHCSTFLSPLICSIVCNEITGRLPETSSFRNLSCLDSFQSERWYTTILYYAILYNIYLINIKDPDFDLCVPKWIWLIRRFATRNLQSGLDDTDDFMLLGVLIVVMFFL